MRFMMLSPCAIGLTACTSYAEADAVPTTPPIRSDGGTCDASALQDLVGETATDELGERIQRESGARTLRWGPPNTAWTMDYRQDRVNVRYGVDMIITDITCG